MNAKLRQSALVGVAIGLAAWSAWSVFKPADLAAPDAARRRQAATSQSVAAVGHAPAPMRVPTSTAAPAAMGALAVRGAVDVAATRDPFDANPWVVKRAPVVATTALVAPAPVPEVQATPALPLPAPPPQLPYRFLGTYAEKADSPSVFLAMGDRLIIAKAGDTLDGGFRLDTVSARELTFTHIQQNVTLRLSVTGGSI